MEMQKPEYDVGVSNHVENVTTDGTSEGKRINKPKTLML